MSVTSVAEARVLVQTGMSDEDLQALIDRIEADIETAIGAPYVDENTSITEMHEGGKRNLLLKRRVLSVGTVTEYATLSDSTGTELTANTDFVVWGRQGRLERIGMWQARIEVVYVPADDRKQWKTAVIDLLRQMISRMPMASESLSGAFSYTAPHWEKAKRDMLRQIMLPTY